MPILLCLWLFSVPSIADANFLDIIFGTDASANEAQTSISSTSDETALSTFGATLNPKCNAPEEENLEIVINHDALVVTSNPITRNSDFNIDDHYADQIEIHSVSSGEKISDIAKMFCITPDTILSFNDKPKGYIPKEGDILLILPFSGVEYTVIKGDTLDSIAAKYKIPKSDIIAANIDLGDNYTIISGEKLIIPGAGIIEKANTSSSKTSKMPSSTAQKSMKSTAGYFISPLPSGHKTQGIHDKYAIDIGAPTGTPIKASASGTVTFAAIGWNGAYGNVVFIKHPNGTETRYAHMSRLNTSAGTEVEQGQVIGYVGSTGRSTGPHLHFEIRGAKNPF